MIIKEVLISLLTKSNVFIYKWGYLGVFLFTMTESGLVVFPLSSAPIIFTFGGILNPFLLAVFAALGGTIGSFTSYILGAGGKDLVEKKYGEKIEKIRKSFDEKGFLWVFTVTLTPIPDNLLCIFLGMIRYDLKKFFILLFIGKFIMQAIVAYSGYYSITWVLKLLEIQLPV